MKLYTFGSVDSISEGDVSEIAWPCRRCDFLATTEVEPELNVLDRLVLELLKVNRYSISELARLTHLDADLIEVILSKLEDCRFISGDFRVLAKPQVRDVEREFSIFLSRLSPALPSGPELLLVTTEPAVVLRGTEATERDGVLLFKKSMGDSGSSLTRLLSTDSLRRDLDGAWLRQVLGRNPRIGRIVGVSHPRFTDAFVRVAVRWEADSGRFVVLQPGSAERSVRLTQELARAMTHDPERVAGFLDIRERRSVGAVRVFFDRSGDLLGRVDGWIAGHSLGGPDVSNFYRELTEALYQRLIAAYPKSTIEAASALEDGVVDDGIAALGFLLAGGTGRFAEEAGPIDAQDATLIAVVGLMLRVAIVEPKHPLRSLKDDASAERFLELVLRLHQRSRAHAHGDSMSYLPEEDVVLWKALLPRLLESPSSTKVNEQRLVVEEVHVAAREVSELFPNLTKSAVRPAVHAQKAFLRVREGDASAVSEFIEQACASVQVAMVEFVAPAAPPIAADFRALAKGYGFTWTSEVGQALLNVRPYFWRGVLLGQPRTTLGGAACAFLISPVDGCARAVASRMPKLLEGLAELVRARGHRGGQFKGTPIDQVQNIHSRWVDILQSFSG